MAHKLGAGSTKNSRDSIGKRLGVKKFGQVFVNAGEIIVRQRGSKYKAGAFVGCGRDFTLYALKRGILKFSAGNFVNII